MLRSIEPSGRKATREPIHYRIRAWGRAQRLVASRSLKWVFSTLGAARVTVRFTPDFGSSRVRPARQKSARRGRGLAQPQDSIRRNTANDKRDADVHRDFGKRSRVLRHSEQIAQSGEQEESPKHARAHGHWRRCSLAAPRPCARIAVLRLGWIVARATSCLRRAPSPMPSNSSFYNLASTGTASPRGGGDGAMRPWR